MLNEFLYENELEAHARDLDSHADRRAWIAPLLATLVTVPGALLALGFTMITPMACDECDTAQGDRFDASYYPAFWGFLIGLVLPLGLLLASWCLPWRRRHTARRVVLAVLAPATLLVLVAVFAALVDWPK